jgi:uncharacterized protein YdaU (DUF1376 family)
VNYYERHIGDYLKDTAHLSLLEHGVYGRLLDVYYTRESPIPVAQVERLIGVRSKEERAALQDVLTEFFVVDGDVLRHARCDREIARYQDKQRKAAASANARWKKVDAQSERNAKAGANAMRTHMRTHSEGNAPSNQTPDTNNQGALVEHQQAGVGFGPDGPARAGFEERPGSGSDAAAAAEAMRAVGLADASATHPRLVALLLAGLTHAELVDAARAAVQGGRGFPWALARAEGQRRDAAQVAALPAASPAVDPDSVAAIKADAIRLGVGEWSQVDDATGRTVPWAEYAAKVRAARVAERGEVAA